MLYKLMLWNLKRHWKRIKELTAHRDYPSSKLVSKYLFNNPIRRKSELADVNVIKSINEMQKVFDAHAPKTIRK